MWPKTASGHFWKNGSQNGQHFLKKWIPYGSPDQTDKLKTFGNGFSSYDLGIENRRSGCKFTINRAVFDGKPIFDLEALWVCLRGILWIQASHQYLGAPSGGFFRPQNRLFGKTIDFDLKPTNQPIGAGETTKTSVQSGPYP